MSRVAQLSSNWHKCFLSPEPLFLPPHTASEETSEAVTLTTKLKINKATASGVHLKQLIHNKVPACAPKGHRKPKLGMLTFQKEKYNYLNLVPSRPRELAA